MQQDGQEGGGALLLDEQEDQRSVSSGSSGEEDEGNTPVAGATIGRAIRAQNNAPENPAAVAAVSRTASRIEEDDDDEMMPLVQAGDPSVWRSAALQLFDHILVLSRHRPHQQTASHGHQENQNRRQEATNALDSLLSQMAIHCQYSEEFRGTYADLMHEAIQARAPLEIVQCIHRHLPFCVKAYVPACGGLPLHCVLYTIANINWSIVQFCIQVYPDSVLCLSSPLQDHHVPMLPIQLLLYFGIETTRAQLLFFFPRPNDWHHLRTKNEDLRYLMIAPANSPLLPSANIMQDPQQQEVAEEHLQERRNYSMQVIPLSVRSFRPLPCQMREYLLGLNSTTGDDSTNRTEDLLWEMTVHLVPSFYGRNMDAFTSLMLDLFASPLASASSRLPLLQPWLSAVRQGRMKTLHDWWLLPINLTTGQTLLHDLCQRPSLAPAWYEGVLWKALAALRDGHGPPANSLPPEFFDCHGNTPLHYATSLGSCQLPRHLAFFFPAMRTARNRKGRTPLQRVLLDADPQSHDADYIYWWLHQDPTLSSLYFLKNL